MRVFYTPQLEEFQPPYQIHFGRVVEASEVSGRARCVVKALHEAGLAEIAEPCRFPLEAIEAVHAPEYVRFLQNANQMPFLDPESDGKPFEVIFPTVFPYSDRWQQRASAVMSLASLYCFDTYTPITPQVFEAARLSAECALSGAEALLSGEQTVFAACRPPGHHATRRQCGGYCYFNNAAVAAHRLSCAGRVVVLDVDFHHGNGTQEIFYASDAVGYISLHGDPATTYPYFSGYADELGEGKGRGYTRNFPLPPQTDDRTYLKTLEEALSALRQMSPRFLILSLGLDAHGEDPLANLALTTECYAAMAQRIAYLGLPTLIVLEGGYNLNRLGELAVTFFRAWEETRNSISPEKEKSV
ncbi:MAG: histone deacetylase family protein [Anaerolineales bacterium]|nr:histone deacetylase family protein [Anaerolineales bacterium]MCS7247457.1 histone deacetylase family protein [Anaerolineales bacterium]MDW8161268.1 histone deacetylase family protein [Anaerolineales bacterium]MDW8447093.1 histone deacetylase family protein [Anaerolineales bacterium]